MFLTEEISSIIDEQVNVSADSETSANGFIKYLDLSKTTFCVSRYLI